MIKCPNCGADAQLSPIMGNIWCRAECDKKIKSVEREGDFVISGEDKDWLFLNPGEISRATKTIYGKRHIYGVAWELRTWNAYVDQAAKRGYVMTQVPITVANNFMTRGNSYCLREDETYEISQWIEYDKYPELFTRLKSC